MKKNGHTRYATMWCEEADKIIIHKKKDVEEYTDIKKSRV